MEDDLLAVLQTIVSGVVAHAPVLTPETRAEAVQGWDSHATVEIIFNLEARYGFQMTAAEMEQVEGVADLLAIVARRRGLKPAARP